MLLAETERILPKKSALFICAAVWYTAGTMKQKGAREMGRSLGKLLLLGAGFAAGVRYAGRTRSGEAEERLRQDDIRRQMARLQKEHEKQDRMRQEFTANVSHELKTPLTSISGYAEILREGLVKSEDVGRFAGKIYEEAQRLITLVEDILNLSRLDEGAPAREPRSSVDLYALCQETVASLSESARQRGIALSVEGERCLVSGVEKILAEIIYNLCDNAIKYNKENGRVEVSVTREPERVVLTVRDTGIGIPPEETDRVFERFYRVDKSHSKQIGGTGLGLSIVKHAAAYHDALVRLDSQLGRGTRVRVLFHPAAEDLHGSV